MPRATGQSTLEDSALWELKRSELQALAKTYGIKANGRNEIIIKSLLANQAFVDSRKEENIAESSKSSASVGSSPNTTDARPLQKSNRYRTLIPMHPQQRAVEDAPLPESIPDLGTDGDRVQLPTAQDAMEVRHSLAAMNEEQVVLQEVVNKLRILNEETRSILDEKAEGLKKMIWTRQILEQLCVDHRGTPLKEETLQRV